MLSKLWHCLRAVTKFRGYKPQPITARSFFRWISQFQSGEDRDLAFSLLNSVIYLNENTVREALVKLNNQLLRQLADEGVSPDKIIYVQMDDAGSSSPVVLNLLRNMGHLEKRGCKLVDSNHVLKLSQLTSEIGEGAIIYVDDFVGTGDQFVKTREFIGSHILGTFSEFLLVPAICEEGVQQVGKTGVEAVVRFIHSKAERPLHPYSNLLNETERAQLTRLAKDFGPECYYDGLGYKRCATMYVLYSNAPDTLPRLLRGSPDQRPKVGIFPRYDDLPTEALGHSIDTTHIP